jgi:hypothetical protein
MRTIHPGSSTHDNASSYHKLMWPLSGPWGIAYVPPAFKLWLHPNEELLGTWSMPTFQLRGGPVADYQPENIGLPLCSERLRDIIEMHRHPSDLIEWLPVEVKGENASYPYHILHLLEELDVIDPSRSIIDARGGVVKPHVKVTKVGKHQIFRYKGGGDTTVCLSDRVRLAILNEGCTGCYFSKLPSS